MCWSGRARRWRRPHRETRPETSGEEVSPKGFDQDSNIQFTLYYQPEALDGGDQQFPKSYYLSVTMVRLSVGLLDHLLLTD